MHLKLTNCILFADDTTIYKSHCNLNYLLFCLKTDLDIVTDWFKANELTLNLSKSECMIFKPNQRNHGKMLPLVVSGHSLPIVKETKFLAVWIDDKLNWQRHTFVLLSKLKKNLNLLKMGKNLLSTHCKKILYHAQICSHINYGLVLWGNMISPTRVQSIQKLQNKCIQLIFGTNATKEKLHEKNLLSVADMIKFANCKLMHNHLNGNLPKKNTIGH